MEKNPQVAENNPPRFSENRSARKNFHINPFSFIKFTNPLDLVAFILKNPLLSIAYNDLNMVCLAFQHSNFSIYYYVDLLLSYSFLALSAKCTIFFVVPCALFIYI
jgi:hypothetical protein